MEFLNFIATNRTAFGEVFWNIITKLGEQTIMIVLLCMIYWCINKKLAHIIGFTFFLSGYLVQGLKIAFRIERPWIKDPNFKPVPTAYETATGYSFPSGHTQAATGVYSSISFHIKHWSRYLVFLIPLAVAFSRMYLGVHTPKDVITAFILTLLISLFISILYKKNEKVALNGLLIITIFFGIALMIYAFILYSNQVISYSYVSDCCKTAGAGIGFSLGVFLEQKYVNFTTKTKTILGQILKIVLGIIGVVFIQSGLKVIFSFIFDQSLLADFIRYMLMILWVAYLWPLIFHRFSNKKQKENI